MGNLKKNSPSGFNAESDQNSANDQTSEQFFKEIDIQFLIHELKDPIAVIETGALTLISKQEKFGSLNERQDRVLKRVLRNAVKAREMLHSLLETGRAEAGCFFTERFKLMPTVHSVLLDALECMAPRIFEGVDEHGNNVALSRFLVENGIALSHPSQLDGLELEQDETKFCQIMGNILKNALHHRQRQVQIKISIDGELFFVDVMDDGPGIDRDYHETIFKRYQQVKGASKGTRTGHGLGLAGARIMARGLGGDIEIISAKGEGATFRLVLPISRGACD
jgi:two-component system, OmpR family, sensor kinase